METVDYLFYFEEGLSAWIPVDDCKDHVMNAMEFTNEEITVRYKIMPMTRDEFELLEDCS